MKAYMELVNNMLLTAEVQQTLVIPHTYISDCRQESFRIFPCSGNNAVLRLGCQLLRWKETGINSLTLWIACWPVPVATCDSPHLCQVCHTAVEVTDQRMPVVPGVLLQPLAGQAHHCHCPRVHPVCGGSLGSSVLCLWRIRVTQSWYGSGVGSTGKMQVTEELRAGHLCLELGVVWATGAGFWSQLTFGAGVVRTSNWAFALQF